MEREKFTEREREESECGVQCGVSFFRATGNHGMSWFGDGVFLPFKEKKCRLWFGDSKVDANPKP